MAALSVEQLVARPREVAECGLSEALLIDLVTIWLMQLRVTEMGPLSHALALPGLVIEPVIELLRREGLAEVRRGLTLDGSLRYALTERGQGAAQAALARSGYVGPAPVPFDRYVDLVLTQSVRGRTIPRARLEEALTGVVLEAGRIDQLGPALASGRALFIYGPAGSGKTFVAKRLARALPGAVFIPHAVAVDEKIIPIFDPLVHRPLQHEDAAGRLRLDAGHDARLVLCARPAVVTGGELTLEMLDVGFDPARRTYQPPVQLMANNGVLVVDDLGRQQVSHERLLNRWIVPMEEGRDYLKLPAGPHFTLPFDVVLVFSTNLDPVALADEAFLRRIGHKIRFDYADPARFRILWRNACEERGIEAPESAFEFLVNERYRPRATPIAACHARDLITMALDLCRFRGEPPRVDRETLAWAWDNYFVQLSTGRS